ncbi:ATP-binding cassette domain-containing protein [Ancylobacter dichloromethanicus]|uniref:Iron-hydroxamate transporter ATP-binding protein n=1 Tax=Ancylobacter dichloromethanicus TaxID=518825 RepID=A0A9W6JD73_9HYPH|nr:ATP-binding cassette domain-containing protein [Ancylobacter dichloromethanicus]MBS7552127.1 ATP-binding cassette domain-containing protein [Ancylobacter dichloromethanicus]GLK73859.1 iron-hydroxamate transporter ATP-binding protein [Ancylobacter dichloromethanicus]
MISSPADSLFELADARFCVGGRMLLHPLTLTVPAGRVVGLIGHNGSGKSTLLKLLGRQLAASAGEIRFEGRPIGAWNARAFARRVAYLPQTAPATGGMTGRELIALGRYPWHGALGRFSPQDRQKIDEAISLTDTTAFADRLVDTLSGGERQRVWIAMLVAQDAGCLLLDEPTSALDIAHQIEVLALIRHLCRQRGTGVVVVLHDVNMAARFCDDIIALHGGKLLARGAPAQMVTPETLERVYGIAMEVIRQDGGGYVAVPRA